MSSFPSNSLFDQDARDEVYAEGGRVPQAPKAGVREIPHRQLEEWYRGLDELVADIRNPYVQRSIEDIRDEIYSYLPG